MNRGFTLIEISIVLLIATFLIGIAFNFINIKSETLYLKNTAYKISSDISFIREMSFSRVIPSGFDYRLRSCGYGLYFSPRGYFAYSFVTSSDVNCDLLASENVINFAPQEGMFYIHTNGEVRAKPLNPILLSNNYQPGFSLAMSFDSSSCSNNIFNTYPEAAIIFYNPYGDLLVFGRNGGWNLIVPNQWENIYFCLSYKNDKIFLRINKLGQIILENL